MSSLIPNINKTFLQDLFSAENEDSIRRQDNRTIKEYRKIEITRITSGYNSPLQIKLGNTVIFSQINAKLVAPRKDRPSEGIISFQVDTHHLKPNADYTSSNEALTEFRISINNILEKCLKESHALDTNILCILPGKIVWKITLDLIIIKNDGNIFDAAIISALSTWLTYKIPFFRIKNGELYYDSFINLTTIHMPICVTNGIFIKKKTDQVLFILDTTLEEEGVMSGTVSICANIFGEISYMQMNTEAQIDLKNIEELINSAEENVSLIHKIIKNFVENENRRVDKIIKLLNLNDRHEPRDENIIEDNENEENKKAIKDMMDIEENKETTIKIFEYKK